MRRIPVFVGSVALVFAAGSFLGCGDDDYGANGNSFWNQNNSQRQDAGTTWECYSANDCVVGQTCNEFHRCVWPPATPDAGTEVLPPETEHEFAPPASGARYVYVALSSDDTVARIDSETLDIDTIPVGDQPDVLVTAPGQDVAVVLNEGSSSVTILRTEADVDTVVTLSTPPHFNRLAVSPTGAHAVAWFVQESADSQGIGSFQDVSVISLSQGSEAVQNISVGFRPREVQFAPDGSAAWVVTEDGVSLLDLVNTSVGYFAPTVALTNDPFTDGDPDEVRVTPDGTWAFARWSTKSLVRAVELATGDIVDLPMGGVPTDLDLTPAGDRLLAVVRSRSQVVLLDVPEAIGDASAIETIDCSPIVVGSAQITRDGGHALLFTNAINSRAISLLDFSTGTIRSALLRKGIRWVAMAPDGSAALVLHNKIPGDPQPLDDDQTQLDKRYGFSLVDLESLFVKLQITESDPGAFAFSPDEQKAYLILADTSTSQRDIAVLDLASFVVGSFQVGSHPVEIGPVAATNRIYVSQEHPLGRISFIDVTTAQLRTVTGFQLNSQVIE